jgi:hypothetical protein
MTASTWWNALNPSVFSRYTSGLFSVVVKSALWTNSLTVKFDWKKQLPPNSFVRGVCVWSHFLPCLGKYDFKVTAFTACDKSFLIFAFLVFKMCTYNDIWNFSHFNSLPYHDFLKRIDNSFCMEIQQLVEQAEKNWINK